MIFWRIVDNQVHPVHETDNLGFEKSEGLQIPDEYLDKQEFMVMRTAHGIGDWGIISAMPRLLKEKYPNCKVYVPSIILLEKLFGQYADNWSSWNNPFQNVINIFDNNPYIDEFVDEYDGEVFHDHYRVYDKDDINIPLVEQMLKFWQFDINEYQDSRPEIYWSDEEKKLGDSIIEEYVGDNDFGCLLISDRYNYTMDDMICNIIDPTLKHFYWTEKPIEQTSFDWIDKALDMRNMSVRIQLYIKSKAKYNVGSQCGTSQIIVRYSDVYSIQRQFPMAGNFVRGEIYLSDDEKRKMLNGLPDKTESKTTTSLKFKADFVDFFNSPSNKNMKVLEVGSSLGHSTKVLSNLFGKVIAIDNLSERHEQSKQLVNRDNVEYVVMDVYRQQWNFEMVDLVFIDCVHDYNHVKSDIENSLKFCNKNAIFVFDDYGLFPEIKKAVDEYIDYRTFKVLKKIGHLKNTFYPTTQNKILKDYEGIICQIV